MLLKLDARRRHCRARRVRAGSDQGAHVVLQIVSSSKYLNFSVTQLAAIEAREVAANIVDSIVCPLSVCRECG